MSSQSKQDDDGSAPTRRRAPTITIDTTAVNSSSGVPQASSDFGAGPSRQHSTASTVAVPDETASPSTAVGNMAGSWTHSQGSGGAGPRQELSNSRSFDSRDSGRPTSPHNVSSPVAGKGERTAGFLSVPSNHRSRQNSVDSDDNSVALSQGETVAASSASGLDKGKGSALSNDRIMRDPDALKPDAGKEDDFKVDDNPFAFSPGQLNKMFNPKSLSAFYALGGLAGIERGLRSDRKAGLSIDETNLDGRVTFDDAVHPSKELGPPYGRESPSPPLSPAATHRRSNEAFADRKRVFSDNRLPEKKGKSLLQLMWITYNDKVLILLSIAAVISLGVGLYQTFGTKHNDENPAVEWIEGVAIIIAVLIVVFVGSLNDYQKERQFAKLNRKKQDRIVKAVRSGKTVEISVFDILAGDVLHIEPGDLVPVDGVLIEGFNIKCDESSATGESDIIRKRPADEVFAALENHEDMRKMDPFIQSGSRVMEGVGTFMVTSTGIYSSYGRTLMALNEDPEITPLQSKLNVIAEYIAKLGGAAGLLLFIVLFIEFLATVPKRTDLNPAQKGQQFLEIFIVVVTIIVVAVPEGLPLAVTLALAFATTRMIKDNNLVRHLKACEVMGNATTICSDKTGTLTQNKMQVVAGTIGTSHRFGAAADAEDAEDAAPQQPISAAETIGSLAKAVRTLLLKSIVLNSTAFEGEVDGVNIFIGSKTESALLILAREHLGMGPVAEERANEKVLQLIPFDSARKCMGIVTELEGGRARLYVKGASEIVLSKCTHILRDPTRDASAAPLTEENVQTIQTLIETYANRSLRTIGIVYRDFDRWPPSRARRAEGDKNEVVFEDVFRDMTFIGMVGIQDPLRPGVPEAVRQCQRAGVTVRMVTGDNRLTAQAIARECGILQPHSIVMEGPEFRNLTKAQQEEIIPRLHVLARSSPEDKRILVQRLKEKDNIVAVTGDGTNDAPALKMADIGFSMGITGTEVAKEASAIILMDDNFTSIVKALKWGRAVNDAVKRFLQFQLTVNVTAVVLTFVSAVSNRDQESVLTAVQLLWVNLIMDTLAALALATDPPQDSVLNRKPEPRGASIISTTMWKMIIGQSIYQLAITFLLYFGSRTILGYTSPVEESQIPTLVFNTFVWMQIFNQWNNRRLDNNFNILEGLTRNWFFIGINILMCGGQVLIIMVAGPAFKISPYKQTAAQWGYAIILGFISIPVGMVIRLIPDRLIERLVPDYLKRRVRDSRVPGLTVSDDDERFNYYPAPYAEVRDELAWLKRVKGGRLRNLKFAMKHPREAFQTMGSRSSRSPSHSRSGSIRAPITPEREDSTMSYGGTTISGVPATHGATTPVSAGGNGATSSGAPPSPDNRKRSRSMRSRSNSALGAPTVMAGIIAAGVAANWSPVDPRRMMGGGSGDDHAQQQQPIGGPSSSSGEAGPSGTSTSVLGGHLSDEPGSIDSPVAATHPDKLSLAVPSKAAVKGGDDRKSLS